MKPALCLFLTVLLGFGTLHAGTTGKITGRITDRGSGEPLPGANIVVVGTPYGASTNADGNYVILNIPPGVYDLRITLVGFGQALVKNVRVVVDQTTITSAGLEASAVGMAEVVIQAERPLIQRDMTATSAVISNEQIKLLPVKDFVQVLQLQAGVVGDGTNLYVRGGRRNEVAYLIDGMYVNDPVLGALGTRINNDAIAELTLLSGTFNAEYGNALSGVVNIVTREGGSKFSASLDARTSEFGVQPYKNYRENRVGATASGPVLGEDMTFFVSGERDARGTWLPFGYDRTMSALGKIVMRFLPEMKTAVSWRYSEDEQEPYNHAYKYIPDEYLRVREKSRNGLINLTHTVLPNFFYDARISYFNQSYYSGLDKDTSQYILAVNSEYLPTAGNGVEFYRKADPPEITDNRTQTWDVRGDAVWQVNKSNEVKLGIEFKKHMLDFLDIYDPKRLAPYITVFQKNPVEGAAYVQDKIELVALVLNLGVRFDYANQLAPFRSNPLDPTSVVNSKSKTQLSPRIGVAHPISDRTLLHFSYGHFFQNPDYERLYENASYDLAVKEPLFGQPDLDAERTTSYEVGLSHVFGESVSGSFTAYYKDVTGLVGTRYYVPYTTGGRYTAYTLYVNEAYGNIKGFDVSVTLRRTKYLAGSLSYSYSTARGSASSETENYPGTTESTLLYPLAWDKPHVLNVNVSLHFPDQDGPKLFDIFPLENTYWNVLLRASSGYPYTPAGRDIGFVRKNSARMPGSYSIDLEVSKEWTFASLYTFGVFVEVINLTDHANVLYVYPDTGDPDVTLQGRHSEDYMKDPSNYGPPRQIRLGARFRF